MRTFFSHHRINHSDVVMLCSVDKYIEAHFIFTKKEDRCAQKYYQFLRKKLSANCTLLLFSSAIIKSLLLFTDNFINMIRLINKLNFKVKTYKSQMLIFISTKKVVRLGK